MDSATRRTFGTIDYVAMLSVVILSIVVGMYSTIRRRNRSTEEYILGSRKLRTVPVTLSIIASSISSMTVIGYPTEVYYNGLEFLFVPASIIFSLPIIYTSFIPVFRSTMVTTPYEYLEIRFSRYVRILCSGLYFLQSVVLLPTIILAPSLTISQVCGLDFHLTVIVSGAVTTIYTTLGGIRAVVWTDVVQTFFMMGGILALVIKGTSDIGGLRVVMERAYNGNRLDMPDFSFDLTERYGFWSSVFGMSLLLITYQGLQVGMVQRYLSLPDMKSAKSANVLSTFGALSFSVMSVYSGVLAFAYYYNCDPLSSNKIRSKDQIISILIMETLSDVPGIPGLFVAAIIGAAISTVSTVVNSISAVVLEDYYKPFNKNVTESRGNMVLKLSSLLMGVLCTSLVFAVEKLGTAIEISISCIAMVSGTILAIFIIGMFFPWIKSKPTLIASVLGSGIVMWINTGTKLAILTGDLSYKTRPVSVEGCKLNFTFRNTTTGHISDNVLGIYAISPQWNNFIGFFCTMIAACLLSLCMDRNDPSTMDRSMFSPLIHRYLPKPKNKVSDDTELSLIKKC